MPSDVETEFFEGLVAGGLAAQDGGDVKSEDGLEDGRALAGLEGEDDFVEGFDHGAALDPAESGFAAAVGESLGHFGEGYPAVELLFGLLDTVAGDGLVCWAFDVADDVSGFNLLGDAELLAMLAVEALDLGAGGAEFVAGEPVAVLLDEKEARDG